MNTWLLLASSWLWTPLSQGEALVCSVAEIETCLAQLPNELTHQVALTSASATEALGGRGALVYPLSHDAISGLVLLSESAIPTQISAYWNNQSYALPLKQQPKLTLWHELGHIEASLLLAQGEQWSAYQHEWLADLYLVWRLAHEQQDQALAWQQYHRRNLAFMTDTTAISHWSSPIILQLFQQYSWQEVGQFTQFSQLFEAFYPQCRQYSEDELAEFASLVGRTFGRGKTFHLPNYMSWRRAALGEYLQPTLASMMGQSLASDWLVEHQMLASD